MDGPYPHGSHAGNWRAFRVRIHRCPYAQEENPTLRRQGHLRQYSSECKSPRSCDRHYYAVKWSPGMPGSMGQRKSGPAIGNDESRVPSSFTSGLFITKTTRFRSSKDIAVDLVSVNPYVPKYFGPEKLTHAQFADNFLSIGIYRI